MKQLTVQLLVLFVFALSISAGAFAALAPDVSLTFGTKSLPDTPGYHLIKGIAEIDGQPVPFATGIFLPRAWFEPHTRLPLVVTLHNRGLNGADGNSLVFEGLGQLLGSDSHDSRQTGEVPAHPINLRTDAPFVGLVPQCPNGFGWESPAMAAVLDRLITQVCAGYHLDDQRVCLTGFSYGASSTWAVALQLPGRFSAIAPIAGRVTADPPRDVLRLKQVAIYLAIGSEDHSIPGETQRMYDALLAAGHEPLKFRLIQGGSHWSYAAVYEDPEFWDWVLSQRIGAAPSTRPALATRYPIYPQPLAVKTQNAQPGHGILCQSWRSLLGRTVASLLDDPSYPAFPSEQRVLPEMQIPRNQQGNFGTRLSGWVCPTVTGDYTFFIACQDQGELRLSPDDRPEHAVRIAAVDRWSWPNDWTQTPGQQSKPVHLLAGLRYAIEGLQKGAEGDNHLSVAWKLPDGSIEAPIATNHLQPATAVSVPGPQIVEMSPPALPREPGLHRVAFTVSDRAHRKPIKALLLIPHAIETESMLPTLVYCPDPDRRDAEGFPLATGPTASLQGPPLEGWSPLMVIEPQAGAEQSWEVSATPRLVALVVDRLMHELPVDPTQVYLTGSNAGGTDTWRLAARLHTRLAAAAPIDAMEVNSAALSAQLAGTAIHIITGVRNGVATDCANRMKDHLATLSPAPEVIYEMQMGDEVAGIYYGKREFYDWLLSWRRPLGQAAVHRVDSSGTPGSQ